MKTLILMILALLLTSCSLLQKKVDSESINIAPGFEYKFPKTGEWIQGNSSPGNIIIGKKPIDGSSVLAIVKYGPIGVTSKEFEELKKTGTLKAHSAVEIISSFKAYIENDAKQGRVKDIKTKFEEKKYNQGSCLLSSQIGKDNGTMPISNEGKWCFNSKTYSYIMLNISVRAPEGRTLPNLDSERNEFFDSLSFTDK